jgi:hypothetical protein
MRRYVLALDSDAYLRSDLALDDYMLSHGVNPALSNWSLMLPSWLRWEDSKCLRRNRSKYPLMSFKKCDTSMERQLINTGALYGYVDPHNSARTARGIRFLRRWQQSVCTPRCWHNRYSAFKDQGCLSKSDNRQRSNHSWHADAIPAAN